MVDTPLSRVAAFSAYNNLEGNSSTDLKGSLTVDNIALHAMWIPAPTGGVVLVLAGLGAATPAVTADAWPGSGARAFR